MGNLESAQEIIRSYPCVQKADAQHWLQPETFRVQSIAARQQRRKQAEDEILAFPGQCTVAQRQQVLDLVNQSTRVEPRIEPNTCLEDKQPRVVDVSAFEYRAGSLTLFGVHCGTTVTLLPMVEINPDCTMNINRLVQADAAYLLDVASCALNAEFVIVEGHTESAPFFVTTDLDVPVGSPNQPPRTMAVRLVDEATARPMDDAANEADAIHMATAAWGDAHLGIAVIRRGYTARTTTHDGWQTLRNTDDTRSLRAHFYVVERQGVSASAHHRHVFSRCATYVRAMEEIVRRCQVLQDPSKLTGSYPGIWIPPPPKTKWNGVWLTADLVQRVQLLHSVPLELRSEMDPDTVVFEVRFRKTKPGKVKTISVLEIDTNHHTVRGRQRTLAPDALIAGARVQRGGTTFFPVETDSPSPLSMWIPRDAQIDGDGRRTETKVIARTSWGDHHDGFLLMRRGGGSEPSPSIRPKQWQEAAYIRIRKAKLMGLRMHREDGNGLGTG